MGGVCFSSHSPGISPLYFCTQAFAVTLSWLYSLDWLQTPDSAASALQGKGYGCVLQELVGMTFGQS